MWQAVQRGWLPPDAITREEYAALRHADPSALRAFAGFGCSFGGKWFGGYGMRTRPDKEIYPDPYPLAAASAKSVLRQAPIMARAHVAQLDYREARPRPGWLIYCDPPYAGTTSYGGLGAVWDAAVFWETAASWARSGCHVLVSEYAAPAGWRSVWSGDARRLLRHDDKARRAEERLFEYDH
jgi:DNA adenine methylase